jgi:hypothetical protein
LDFDTITGGNNNRQRSSVGQDTSASSLKTNESIVEEFVILGWLESQESTSHARRNLKPDGLAARFLRSNSCNLHRNQTP